MNHLYEITGCLRIKLKGDEALLAINRALSRGAGLKSIKKQSFDTYEVEVYAASYFTLKKCSANCEIEYIGAKGAAALLFSLKKHFAALVSLLILIIGCAVLSNYYIGYNVQGIEQNSLYLLNNVLKDEGLTPLLLKDEIDKASLKKAIEQKLVGVDRVNTIFSGSKLYIDIIEGSVKPEIASGLPCDLISAYDGVIVKADVYSGKSEAVKGMQVKAGDTLVRGCYYEADMLIETESSASIIALVNHTEICEITLKSELYKRTGEKSAQKYLKTGGICVKIDGDITFDTYETVEASCVTVGRNLALPLKILDTLTYETAPLGNAKESTLALMAKESAYYECLKHFDEQDIVSVSEGLYTKDNKLYCAVTVSALVDICISAPPMPATEGIVGDESI